MLKRILIILLAALVGISFFSAFHTADLTEYQRLQEAPLHVGTSFTIPVHPILDDPDVLLPALEHAASQNHINLFRTSVGYDVNDEPYTLHFVLLATDQTAFFSEFRLKDGRFLNPTETKSSSFFLSSKDTDDVLQVGTLDDIGRNNTISIYSLSASFDSLPTAGNYVIESHDHTDIDAFFETLIADLNESGANVARKDFVFGSGIQGKETIYFDFRQQAASWGALIVVILLVAYRQLFESKRTGILLLLGSGVFHTWFLVTGRIILCTMTVLSIICFLVAVLIPGTTVGLITTVLAQLAAILLITLLASLITVLYIASMNTQEALKNRKDTKMLVVFNLFVKCVLTVILIVTGTSCVARFEAIRESESILGSWQQTSQYGIFYPKYNGADLQELQSGQLVSTASEVYGLYPALNNRGALFIDSMNYEPNALLYDLPPEVYRSMCVNPNYLVQYPILGVSNQPISVAEEETDWVILVPESYRSEETKILEYFREKRNGSENSESIWAFEMRMFGRATFKDGYNQAVRIIWTASGQRVFSFNPKVFPEDGNCIVDPIVEVMTMGNSSGVDRLNSFTGGLESCVKIKLINQDTRKTLQELQDILIELKLDDNFRYIVTLDDYALLKLQQLQLILRNVVFQGFVILALFVFFSFQSVTLLFEQNARRVAVRRLHGYSFMYKHGEFFFVFLLTWSLVFVAIAGAIVVLRGRLDIPHEGPLALYSVAMVFILFEILISAATLSFTENRRIYSVLKGEF